MLALDVDGLHRKQEAIAIAAPVCADPNADPRGRAAIMRVSLCQP